MANMISCLLENTAGPDAGPMLRAIERKGRVALASAPMKASKASKKIYKERPMAFRGGQARYARIDCHEQKGRVPSPVRAKIKRRQKRDWVSRFGQPAKQTEAIVTATRVRTRKSMQQDGLQRRGAERSVRRRASVPVS
jgi:hypothetical protein